MLAEKVCIQSITIHYISMTDCVKATPAEKVCIQGNAILSISVIESLKRLRIACYVLVPMCWGCHTLLCISAIDALKFCIRYGD